MPLPYLYLILQKCVPKTLKERGLYGIIEWFKKCVPKGVKIMKSVKDIWQKVLDILATQLTPTAMETWFLDCVPVEMDDCRLVLVTSTEFKQEIITKRFGDRIKAALYDLFATDFELLVLTENDELPGSQEDAANSLPEMAGYTFDHFIVGNSIRFAHAANQMVKSLKEGTAEEFRTRYRNVDLFLVDDIQFIAGKQQTQNEFFHTFNSIYEAGNQIVITSDRPPQEMATLDDRLRTRFEWGLMADIQPPDLETRMAITRNKAAQLGLILSDDAVTYIADNITDNIRRLEGVVKKLTAYKEILNEIIDIDSVKRAIKDVIKDGIYTPTPEIIIRETARYYQIEESELRGQSRSKNVAMARQISMYLIRTLTSLSLQSIGEMYEGRNHATVLSSIRKVENLLQTDQHTGIVVRDITSNINSSERE